MAVTTNYISNPIKFKGVKGSNASGKAVMQGLIAPAKQLAKKTPALGN
jgi:hypothetical protein